MTKYIILILGLAVSLQCKGALEIYRVIPDKIIYRLNEDAKADILVANTGNAKESCQLKVYDVYDINTKKQIADQKLELAGKSEKNIVAKWNSGDQRYGHAIRAELWQNGKMIAHRSEFFNVINEWWRVNIIGGGLSSDDKLRKEIMDYYHVPFSAYKHSFYPDDYMDPVCGPFLSYSNHSMIFASMPSLFGDHTPDVPDDIDWFSGRGWYKFNSNKLKNTVKNSRKWGFKNSMYSISAMTGPSGFEIARRHPEYVQRTETGAFGDAGYASPDPMQLAKGITSSCSHWYGVAPDLFDVEVVKFGVDELIKGINYFGWDGMFFDGCGYVARPGYDWRGDRKPDKAQPIPATSARNIKLTREMLLAAKPDLFIWYNGSNPMNVDSNKGYGGNGGGLAGKLEMTADSRCGALKELQAGQLSDPRNASHSWRGYLETQLAERDAYRRHKWELELSDIVITGSLHPEGFIHSMPKDKYNKTRSQWAWSNHALSIMAATQTHPFGNGGGMRPILQLMTRFSKFFWNEGIKIDTKAYRSFEVEGLREVWWDDTTYRKVTPEYTEYIINMLNSPASEKAVKDIIGDPPAAEDIEVTCVNWSDPAKVKAWAVQPYGFGDKVKEPKVYKLNPQVIDECVTYKLPPFKYYTLVVVRKYKK